METVYILWCIVFAALILFLLFQKKRAVKQRKKETGRKANSCSPAVSDDYDADGYNMYGRNAKGKYNRFYDRQGFCAGETSQDGFLDPRRYPFALSSHAVEQMHKRMNITEKGQAEVLAFEAYQFGKSARQFKLRRVEHNMPKTCHCGGFSRLRPCRATARLRS